MPKRKTPKNHKKNPKQVIFNRFMLIIAFFILWIGAIGARLVHLQINQSEELREQAQNQRRDIKKEKQLRGTIYDRADHALAMTVKVKSLYADPSEVENVDATAREVAKLLKVKVGDVLNPLKTAKENNRRFVWLAHKLDDKSSQKIDDYIQSAEKNSPLAAALKGLHWQEEQKRSYPYNSLAAHVIGFSNAEDVGSAGIEQSQEDLLHGAVIKTWEDRDRIGRVYNSEENVEREEPKDVVLTISSSIQYKTEQALEQGVKNSNAKSGMAIVFDPKTGEILALANYPTFDPNKYGEFQPESFTNRAIHDIYSPGSVFKAITYSGAIDAGSINPNGTVDCRGGYVEVAGRRFNDPHATKIMGYDEAFAVSSNAAAIKTALELGKNGFYGYARKFGFGAPTGIELPAEANGIFRSPETWNGDSLASMAIGYEIGVTAMQVATAIGTIANDGVRVQPHIIKEIRRSDGKVIPAPETEKRQVISAETAKYMRRMMRQVVLKGTARRAQLNGYTSAGKTGTAWKYNPQLKRPDPSKFISSFVGFAPAENPEVVIAVVMDEPRVGGRDGGQVSAPVFRDIAEQILPELNVIPDGSTRQEVLTADNEPREDQPDAILNSAKVPIVPEKGAESKNTAEIKKVSDAAQKTDSGKIKKEPEKSKDKAREKTAEAIAPPDKKSKEKTRNKDKT